MHCVGTPQIHRAESGAVGCGSWSVGSAALCAATVKFWGTLQGTASTTPPINGKSLCIKSQSSSYLSQGGWARTTNCLGVYSSESVLHSLWLSLFSHTGFSQSIIRLSRRPQLCTLLWESSPNTATKPTPLPSSMNTNKTSLVRFCEASLQQASVSEMFISDVVCRCARRLSHTQYYASLIKQIVLYLFICIHLGVNASKIPQGG